MSPRPERRTDILRFVQMRCLFSSDDLPIDSFFSLMYFIAFFPVAKMFISFKNVCHDISSITYMNCNDIFFMIMSWSCQTKCKHYIMNIQNVSLLICDGVSLWLYHHNYFISCDSRQLRTLEKIIWARKHDDSFRHYVLAVIYLMFWCLTCILYNWSSIHV